MNRLDPVFVQEYCCFFGKVGEDQIRPCPSDGSEHLHHRASSVDPSPLGCRFEHGELPAHIVRRQRQEALLAHPSHNVKVRKRGFHHDDIRSLLDVEPGFFHGFQSVRRVHLVACPVSELRRRFGRLSKGAVKGGGILHRVGQNTRVVEACRIKGCPNGRHTAVHHVRGPDKVCPCVG